MPRRTKSTDTDQPTPRSTEPTLARRKFLKAATLAGTGAIASAGTIDDGPALVRDFTKFDDTPISLAHFAESANRAYKFSMTPPYGPVLLAVDQNLQED